MEHRRIASFGICSLLFAATPALAAPSSEQAVEVSYRGTYVCQSFIAGRDILRVPIDLVVHNGNVEFARPLLSRLATQVVGNEMAHGTTDADGKIHLTSTWHNGGIFHAEYSGTLAASGGTFTGTQIWRGPRGQNGSRTCTAAFVQLAATNRSPIADRTDTARSIAIRAVRLDSAPRGLAPRGLAGAAVRRPTIKKGRLDGGLSSVASARF